MNILAIDTSTAWAGVALEFDGVRSSATWQSIHNHGRELVPAITEVMASANCDLSELDCIAVALGPGGFSAVRVGVSCALGIASPRGLTTVGIPTHYLQARAGIAALGPANPDGGIPKARGANVQPAALVSAIPIGRHQSSTATFDFPLGPIDAPNELSICNKNELQGIATEGRTVVVDDSAGFGSPRPPEVMLDIAIESMVNGLANVWPIRPIYAREPTITRPGPMTLR